jgi:methionyl aminopeptidase
MIFLKTEEEIQIMKEAGKRLAEVLNILKKETKEGIKTKYLDDLAYKLIKERDSEPAFLNYKVYGRPPFPASLCVSVNEIIVHGIPSDYKIKNGDLVKLDIGLKYKGYYADMACTVGVGEISDEDKKLISAVEEAFFNALKYVYPGNTLGDIGWVISNTAKKYGVSVADKLIGHGIGKNLHEEPQVLNVGLRGHDLEIEEGMVLAIEPMFVLGDGRVIELKDGSFKSKDNSKTAHFEHTVAVLKNGPMILTKES